MTRFITWFPPQILLQRANELIIRVCRDRKRICWINERVVGRTRLARKSKKVVKIRVRRDVICLISSDSREISFSPNETVYANQSIYWPRGECVRFDALSYSADNYFAHVFIPHCNRILLQIPRVFFPPSEFEDPAFNPRLTTHLSLLLCFPKRNENCSARVFRFARKGKGKNGDRIQLSDYSGTRRVHLIMKQLSLVSFVNEDESFRLESPFGGNDW